MHEKELFNTVIATLGVGFTYIFGGWDKCLVALVLFIVLDYTTGIIAAVIQEKINSHTGFNGLLRKATIFAVLIVAVSLDRLLSNETWVFRTIVAYFYIANEGISILENCGKCGVPLPPKILDKLEQLKDKEEE